MFVFFLAFISHLSLVNVAVIASVATLLLLLALFLGIRHLNKKTRAMTVNEGKINTFFLMSSLRTILIFITNSVVL